MNENKRFTIIAVLFLLHLIEEYVIGFVYVDRILLWAAQFFLHLGTPLAYLGTPLLLFTLFQILLWGVMITLYYKAKANKKMRYYSLLVGAIIVFEAHHVIEAVIAKEYYPGTLTAALIIIIGLPLLLWRRK